MPKPLHHVQQLLGRYQHLRKLQKNIQQQEHLLLAIKALLPEGLAQHCVHAGIDKSQLKIATDSPVWASKLRFLTPQLLSQLRKNYPSIANIKVLSKPGMPYKTPRKQRKKTVKRHYPAHISTTLEEQAEHIPSTELGDALRRLAKTLKS